MKEKIEMIDSLFLTFKENAVKQQATGNKAAGTRARKAALEMINTLKEFRKESLKLTKTE